MNFYILKLVFSLLKRESDELLEQIYNKLPQYDAVLRKSDLYGQRYTVDMEISGSNGKTAIVRTGWIIKNNSLSPELTTLFVK
ncbi:DUF6883 domain-containing protein [Listeria costaricensis]|uniref:DUF6883 domain-containing protein n=1 Tax=Listeria costaricensis TaxID=2026604 RepID=UPI00308450B8